MVCLKATLSPVINCNYTKMTSWNSWIWLNRWDICLRRNPAKCRALCTAKNHFSAWKHGAIPWYHGENLPLEIKPDSVFPDYWQAISPETIFRLSDQMCSYSNIHLMHVRLKFLIYNTQLYGIRIRGLNNYSLISDIQGCLYDHGINSWKGDTINNPVSDLPLIKYLYGVTCENLFKDWRMIVPFM